MAFNQTNFTSQDSTTYKSNIDGNFAYLYAAVSTPTGTSVGDVKMTATGNSGVGWLLLQGDGVDNTIGNLGSGASARANADCYFLFYYLWQSMDNTILTIQDSSGTPTVRGASAVADWNAYKRLPLPPVGGRVIRAYGQSYPPAGTLGFFGLGARGGDEFYSAPLPAHAHNVGIGVPASQILVTVIGYGGAYDCAPSSTATDVQGNASPIMSVVNPYFGLLFWIRYIS